MRLTLLPVILLALPVGLSAQAQPAAVARKPAPAKVVAKAPVTTTPPSIRVPAVTTFHLANGMRVWLAPDDELPSVSGKLVFNAGAVIDPASKPGLAALVSEMLVTGGTTSKTPVEARRFLAARAAEFSNQTSAENTTLSFWTLADHTAEVLGHLAENVASPAFERVTFFSTKDRMRRATERRNDVPAVVAQREFEAGAFGAAYHPPVELAGVSLLQREDLFDFHRRAYRPESAQLLVTGDFEPSGMKALLERTFGAWKPAPAPGLTRHPVSLPGSSAVRTASVPNAAATAVEIGYPLENASVDDYAALQVLTQLLVPAFEEMRAPTSRNPPTVDSLVAQVRITNALPSFRIVGQTRLRETVEAVRDALAALDQIRFGSVTPAEFQTARTRAIQRFQSDFSRPQTILGLFGSTPQAWGLPSEFLPKAGAKLASINTDEFVQTAKRLLVPARRVVSIAGETQDFRSPLDMLKLPVTTANMVIAPAPPEGAPSAEQASRGAEMWQRMRKALGVDRVPVRDAEIQVKGVVFVGRSSALEQHQYWLAPGTLRIDQKADRDTTTYFNDNSNWFYDGFRVAPFGPAGVRQYRGEVFRMVHWLAARNLAPPLSVHDLGSGIMRVVDGAESVDIALNDKTGLPETLWYTDAGSGQRAEERMFDYKDFGGVPYWGRLEMYREGGLIGELNTVSARFNAGLTAPQVDRRPDQK
jgi:zinc protease